MARKKLIIDRTKWGRGSDREKYGLSVLFNARGNMCCLGFWCVETQRVKKEKMLDVGLPAYVGRWRDWHIRAMRINDNPHITDADRERLLKDLFWEEDKRRVEFIN